MPHPTDRQLLATIAGQAKARPEEIRGALAELYDRHIHAVLHFAERLLADSNLAEDVAQDVFLTVTRKADTFGGDEPAARGWLLAIAGNRARDLQRSNARRRRREAAAAKPESNTDGTHASWEIRDALAQRLSSLEAKHRLALELRLRDQLSFRDIAAATGVSLRTAKYRVADALAQLRATDPS